MTNYSKHVQQIAKLGLIPKGSRIYLAVPYTSDNYLEQVMRFEKVSHAGYRQLLFFKPFGDGYMVLKSETLDSVNSVRP